MNRCVPLAAAAVLLASVGLRAQSELATLTGSVTDSSGAVLAW